ncbi:Feline leukemia virus subgroup C receptor-related protein 2-like protein, partial [Leptotrombidium deliense]
MCQQRTVSKKRFVILSLFSTLTAIQFGINNENAVIANILMKFYNISAYAVNFASVSDNVLFLLLMIPSSYSIKKFGVRKNIMFGATCLSFGTLVKSFSAKSNRFHLLLTGQYIAAIGSSFTYPLFLQLPRIWFPKDEIATAIS